MWMKSLVDDSISELLFKVENSTLKKRVLPAFFFNVFRIYARVHELCNKCYTCMYNGRFGLSLDEKKLITDPRTAEKFKICNRYKLV